MINPTVTRRAEGGWHFEWEEGSPPYELWLDGVLLTMLEAEEYDFVDGGYEDEPPAIEVLDGVSAAVAGNELYPPFVVIQWRGLQTAIAYVVRQYDGASWQDVAEVMESARGYYSWRSPALEDASSEQFRVVALDGNGNEGTALSFTLEVCRNPAPPEVEVEINGDGDIEVTSA